ncbi:complement factor B-like, partial [Clinocottus analis]|uniref:complement factor B-like n=1 Tax=Clinocottus analis TaxID=304258 RepID=UPI0035C19483
RTVRVAEGSRMNVYILLDTSGSIREQDFELSRGATIALVQKLDSYEVQLKFHVLSFASEARDIVDIRDADTSGSVDDVVYNLEQFDYHSHGSRTGTNLHAALRRVGEVMSYLKNSGGNRFNETQNIVIIETDGHSNTGNKPLLALNQIRNLLGYSHTTQDHTDETMLDVYVFGIGDRVNRDQLNSLASKKRGEKHVFVVKDFQILGHVFNSIISDKSVTMCGVAQEHDGKQARTRPWHVSLLTAPKKGPCVGSIVSPNWVLTAAHCLVRASTDVPEQLHIRHGEGMAVSQKVLVHPEFNVRALARRNVSEFYDYDVALIQVNGSIPLSWGARPICLPCTIPGDRAMKRVNSTCQQHRQELLPHEETPAFFIHKNSKLKHTHVHTGSQRPSCVEKARRTLREPTDVTLEEYVPDRFLCSGGSAAYQDALSCKGDSGGSLFLQKRKRYFQVGVVSWGTRDPCSQTHKDTKPPPDGRDLHIDLFQVMPWLKQHLGEDVQFLPDVD